MKLIKNYEALLKCGFIKDNNTFKYTGLQQMTVPSIDYPFVLIKDNIIHAKVNWNNEWFYKCN